MKKIITAAGILTIGVLSYVAYHYWDKNNLSNNKVHSENEHLKNVVQSQNIPDNLYHNGIDTTFIFNGDTFLLKDLSTTLSFVIEHTDSNAHTHEHGKNYEYWKYYLKKPHPNVGTIRRYFKEAADEFDVPVEILHAIGQIENNWTQMGPSIDQGWGIMHLVDNNYCTTLIEAANAINLPPQVLKDNAKENIRGAAALLAKYAGDKRAQFTSYEEWYPAMKKFSGLINEEVQTLQLEEYTRVLYKGNTSVTLWGEEIVLHSQPKIYKK